MRQVESRLGPGKSVCITGATWGALQLQLYTPVCTLQRRVLLCVHADACLNFIAPPPSHLSAGGRRGRPSYQKNGRARNRQRPSAAIVCSPAIKKAFDALLSFYVKCRQRLSARTFIRALSPDVGARRRSSALAPDQHRAWAPCTRWRTPSTSHIPCPTKAAEKHGMYFGQLLATAVRSN